MKQSIKSIYPEVASLISLYCNANNFDMAGFRDQIEVEKWRQRHPTFEQDFKRVVCERLISAQEYLELAEEDFDTEDELYEHLKTIFDCIYRGGPLP